MLVLAGSVSALAQGYPEPVTNVPPPAASAEPLPDLSTPGGAAAAGQPSNQSQSQSQSPAPSSTPANVPAAMLVNSMDALNNETKLNKGDVISYRVIQEQKDTPTPLQIAEDGEIDVPLLGRYPAKGKTCKQLAMELKPLLEKDYFYNATVIIGIDSLSTRSPGRVYLTGAVRSPGAISLPPNEDLTLSRAILLNGGLGDFADRRRVKLLRKKPDGTTETKVYDLKSIIEEGHTEKDPVLQPDDTVIVPEKLFNI